MEHRGVGTKSVVRARHGQAGFYHVDFLLIIVGGLVMLVLPVVFVGSLALAVIKRSRAWGLATVASGILSVAATVALLFLAGSATDSSAGSEVVVGESVTHRLPGGMSIEIPAGWVKSETGERSVLFSSPGKKATFAVIAESREEFARGFPLSAYAEFYAEQIDDQLGNGFQRGRFEPVAFGECDGYLVPLQHLAETPTESVIAGFLQKDGFFYRMIGKESSPSRGTVGSILGSIRFEKGERN